MTKNEIRNAILAYRLAMLANDCDFGRFGKILEVETRDYILKRGIRSMKDVKARNLNQNDAKARGLKWEIKSGSGAVNYAELDGFGNPIKPFTKESLTAENVLPDADMVIWFPFPKEAIASTTPFKCGFVFTRDEFIKTLDSIGKKGLRSSIKVSKHGAQINIQTISNAIENRLFDILEEMPTVEDYFTE